MPVRPLTRGQDWLLPPSIREMIPDRHIAVFLAEYVEGLDLEALGFTQVAAVRGEPEYDVRVLLTAWLYGGVTQVRSTRRLEALAQESIPLMWLLGRQRPDHSTLWRFLERHEKVIHSLLTHTTHTAIGQGLVDFELQAVDGTRVASLSRHKALNRGELEALDAHFDRFIQEMEQSELALGEGELVETHLVSPELADAKVRSAKIKEALSEVNRRAREQKGHGKAAVDPKTGEVVGPSVHPADPQAAMMKGRHGFVLGYNAQVAVDSKAGVIVAADVTASATDNDQQVPMLRAIQETTGRLAAVTVMDAGYHSANNLVATQGLETDLYVADPALSRNKQDPEKRRFHKDMFEYVEESDSYLCPRGQTLTLEGHPRKGCATRTYRCHECQTCDCAHLCTKSDRGRSIRIRPEDLLLRQNREKLRSSVAHDYMRKRSAVVEGVFGIIKVNLGLTRFLRTGLERVRTEWHLLCTAYNLRKLWKYRNAALDAAQ